MKILILTFLLFGSNFIFAKAYSNGFENLSASTGIEKFGCIHFDDTIPTFEVDDYPVTDSMFKINSDDLEAAGLRSVDRIWFSNNSLGQTLIFEIYTDYFRMNTFHFSNNDIPAELLSRLVLYDSTGNYATEQGKTNGILELQKLASPISYNYFITNKGFALGDKRNKAIGTYDKPDTITWNNGVEKLQWKFVGDIYFYDRKIDLKGKPLAEHSFGHILTMFFREDKLIGIILENEIP